MDSDLSRRMGEAGRRRVVDSYSWQSIARQTLALYETIVSQ
jgi:starch synthase